MDSQSKKTYERPILTKYGLLKDLTAGGTGSARENGQPQPAKRP